MYDLFLLFKDFILTWGTIKVCGCIYVCVCVYYVQFEIIHFFHSDKDIAFAT